MSFAALTRRRIRVLGGTGGDYGGARYVPRYTLPVGTTYNPATGLVEYTTPSYTPPANEVLLTDQGSRSANRTLLQATLDNSASDSLRIRLAPVTTDWGDEIAIPAGSRPGVGLYIEPASVKDGGFVRSAGQRIQKNDAGLAPFRLLSAPGAWYGAEANIANLFQRQTIRFNANCRNVRLVGLDVRPDPTWATSLPARSGDIYGAGGMIGTTFVATPTSRPGGIVIDRCRIMGQYERQFLRGLWLSNSEAMAVVDCHVDDVTPFGQQGQGIVATEGGSGWLVHNNYIAAGGTACQHILWGGGDELYAGNDPIIERTCRDIIVGKNLFDFPAQWITDGLATMCHYETKHSLRSVVQGNVFRRYRGVGANNTHTAVTLKGGEGLGQDQTFRANLLDDCVGAFTLLGGQRHQVSHNLVTPSAAPRQAAFVPRQVLISSLDFGRERSRQRDYAFEWNTIPPGREVDQSFVRCVEEFSDTAARDGFVLRDNILGMPENAGIPHWYFWSTGQGSAASTWASRANVNGSAFTGNVTTVPVPNPANRVASNAEDDLFLSSYGALSFDGAGSVTGPAAAVGKGADGALVAAAVAGVNTGL